MFAQCTRKCASSAPLIVLLCCILAPLAQADKVSERIQTQALNHVCGTTETVMAEKQLFFHGILQSKECCSRCVFIICGAVNVRDSGLCPACCCVLELAF